MKSTEGNHSGASPRQRPTPEGSGAAVKAAERAAGVGQGAATAHSAMEPAVYRREAGTADDSAPIRNSRIHPCTATDNLMSSRNSHD